MPLNDAINCLVPQEQDPLPQLGNADKAAVPLLGPENRINAAEQEIKTYLGSNGLHVNADGVVQIEEKVAKTLADIADCAIADAPTAEAIIDELVLGGSPHKPSKLKAALRKVLRDEAKDRRKRLVHRLVGDQMIGDDRAKAQAALIALVAKTFDGNADLNARVLLHFMYQVKCKLANLPVSDHLMPIIVSVQQGVGKTRFVKRLLEPLEELAKSVLFSDIADRRSIFVFRHPVLIMDDMERLAANDIPIVKNRITGDDVVGRGMHSNSDIGTRQRATFIGTSNTAVSGLVPDETGHRRFYEMTFRNANPAAGGDATIWPMIANTDFLEIWRTVDPFVASPLSEVRAQVFGVGSQATVKSKVHAWALNLDIEGEAVGRILERAGAASLKLYDLYCEDTRDARMSVKEFGTLMREATSDPKVPFDWAKRLASGVYFPVRQK